MLPNRPGTESGQTPLGPPQGLSQRVGSRRAQPGKFHCGRGALRCEQLANKASSTPSPPISATAQLAAGRFGHSAIRAGSDFSVPIRSKVLTVTFSASRPSRSPLDRTAFSAADVPTNRRASSAAKARVVSSSARRPISSASFSAQSDRSSHAMPSRRSANGSAAIIRTSASRAFVRISQSGSSSV